MGGNVGLASAIFRRDRGDESLDVERRRRRSRGVDWHLDRWQCSSNTRWLWVKRQGAAALRIGFKSSARVGVVWHQTCIVEAR
jgi:hypothetical protein